MRFEGVKWRVNRLVWPRVRSIGVARVQPIGTDDRVTWLGAPWL